MNNDKVYYYLEYNRYEVYRRVLEMFKTEEINLGPFLYVAEDPPKNIPHGPLKTKKGKLRRW